MAVRKFNESIYLQDNPDEEQQLLQRLAAGDIRAFWPLWQQHRDCMFRCCLSWTNGNSVEAEDLLSQAMLKAWEKVQKFAEKIGNFKSWLATLIRNFWIDIKRRRGANQVEDIEAYAAQEDLGLVAVGDTPASALERDDKKMVIRRAIDELPATMRETFILHFYEQLSHQEIAERQKVPYQNVCKRISQARAILAKKLRGYFIGEEGTEPATAKVPAKPAKSLKAAQKAAQVEPILPETVTLSEKLEESEELSHQEIGEPQEISCQNVGERICEAPAILEGEDGAKMALAVMPVGREPAIEEMSQGNPGVEPVVGVPVILSVAVAEVECVGGEELPVVAVSVGDSESDSVSATSEGRFCEFNVIGKPVVGAFPPWLSKPEEDEKLSHQEMGNRQEISGQNVGERICEVPAILEISDGTIMELAVMPVGREPAIEEMSQENSGVEPVVGVPVILSVAVAEVECVAGQELPVVAVSVGNSDSDSVAGSSGARLSEFNVIGKPVVTELGIEKMSQGNAGFEPVVGVPVTLSVAVVEVECVGGEELPVVAVCVGDSESDSVATTSGGRLYEFNFIRKQIVGAFPPWLSSFAGSQLFHGLLVLGKVAGEFVLVRSSRSPPLYCFPYKFRNCTLPSSFKV